MKCQIIHTGWVCVCVCCHSIYGNKYFIFDLHLIKTGTNGNPNITVWMVLVRGVYGVLVCLNLCWISVRNHCHYRLLHCIIQNEKKNAHRIYAYVGIAKNKHKKKKKKNTSASVRQTHLGCSHTQNEKNEQRVIYWSKSFERMNEWANQPTELTYYVDVCS